MATILSDSDRERLREIYNALPSNLPRVYEPYPVKRKKLAKIIHDIDELMKAREWVHWRSWASWDFERLPLTYCFVCQYPVKLRPFLSQYDSSLLRLECSICGLIHYDSKHD